MFHTPAHKIPANAPAQPGSVNPAASLSEPACDIEVRYEGSLVILLPKTDAGEDWMAEHLPEDAPPWGLKGVAVELRFVKDIALGMINDGLVLA